jgi:adenosyl cobinamide kinase/adenosyl cobinamide phosphate guanylyltransferase
MKALSVKQAFSIVFKLFEFTGLWLQAFGKPETSGFWYLGGGEKNGKSTFALMLAKYLTAFDKVLYISAEEGISKDMIAAMRFAGLSDQDKNFNIIDYEPWEDIDKRMESRKCAKIIFIDNSTVYRDEVTKRMIMELKQKKHVQNKLIIMVCHEEKGQPDNALATHWRKLAKIIIQAEGLKAIISGRCPGGTLMINEEKANLYWGT